MFFQGKFANFLSGFLTGPVAEKILGAMFGKLSDVVVHRTTEALKIGKGGKGKADEIIYLMASLWSIHTLDEEGDLLKKMGWELTKEEMYTVEDFLLYLLNIDESRNANPDYIKKEGQSFLLPDFILFVAQSASEFETAEKRKARKKKAEKEGEQQAENEGEIEKRRNLKYAVTFLKRLAMEPDHKARFVLCEIYRVWEKHRAAKYLGIAGAYGKEYALKAFETIKNSPFVKDTRKEVKKHDSKWAKTIQENTHERPGFLAGVFGKEKPKSIFDRFGK